MSPLLRKALPYLLCFAAGFGTSESLHREPETLVVTETAEAKKETVYVERIVTKTTKPDGTVVERQEDRSQAKVETSKTERTVKLSAPAKTRYSLDLRYLPSLSDAPSSRDVDVQVGYRIGDSNAWLTTGYSVKHNQVSVGLRYEW